MGQLLRVQVVIDTDELRCWANWHTDRAPAGVAHILHEAAGSYQGE